MLTLPEALEQADVIACVRVESVADISGREKLPSGTYRRTASVKVLESLKGAEPTQTITFDHDNGYTCPNVILMTGQTAIIFARKLPSGHYEVMNTYAGLFSVSGDIVDEFYLLRDRPDLAKRAKIADIFAELKNRFPRK